MSYGYKPMPRNDQQLTVAQVDERVRDILNSSSVYGSYAPRSIPQISLDKRIVENLPLGAEDGTEVFLRVGDGNSVADMLYLASLPGWVQIGQAPVVTTLTGLTAIDGMRVVYDTGADGVRWDLVYDTSDGTTYPWLFVGGSSMYHVIATQEAQGSGSYIDSTTPGPTLTVPRAGVYELRIEAALQCEAGRAVYMSYSLNGATATDPEAVYTYSSSTSNVEGYCGKNTRPTFAAGDVLLAKYKISGGTTGYAKDRTFTLKPVKVG